jgi:hypothetical protein
MLSCLGALVHPKHPLKIQFATEMVVERMATLLATDNKRKCMLVANVAEPKLVIAATSTEDRSRKTYFVNELAAALQYAFLSGAESQDLRGELVAQIIWLLAVNQAATLVGMSVGG